VAIDPDKRSVKAPCAPLMSRDHQPKSQRFRKTRKRGDDRYGENVSLQPVPLVSTGSGPHARVTVVPSAR
jgi:hypothetical protein